MHFNSTDHFCISLFAASVQAFLSASVRTFPLCLQRLGCHNNQNADLWGLGCNTYYRAEMMSGWQEQHLTSTNKVDAYGTLKNRKRKQQTLITAKMTRNNQLRNARIRCFALWRKRRRHDELIILKLVQKLFLNEPKITVVRGSVKSLFILRHGFVFCP